ncbi:MarR family transcriptional regulator [Marinobacter sp. NP-6]|uniref:MarR family winged helix-turn-helix transcriptional regulator n=1 Tax=Marinobacter sp. NP-6 TaxID=2488666 RepID=UPI000FC9BC10|nr:MarR family transcriptional regulator [Marinobacter sp. NP-6]RUT76966.1 MarR family transcriptional regulator [Marinobacter sp. NP-6]
MKGFERIKAVNSSTPAMARALPELPMGETILVRMLRIGVAGMTGFFEPVFRSLDLTENGFHVLCLLSASDSGSLSPGELSELVGTSRANMTRILESLSKDGLVSRTTPRTDARRQIIHITKQGKACCSDAVPRMVAPLKIAFSELTEEEKEALNTLLRKLILSFDKPAFPLGKSPENNG